MAASYYFLSLYATTLLAMLGLHLGRTRFTLAPVFAFAAVLSFLIWQLHQSGWWIVWGGFNINAAFLAPTPAILLGMSVVYAMDGMRAARAYLLTIALAASGSIAFLEFLSGLSRVVPLPSIFYPPLFSQMALAVALVVATAMTVPGCELARRVLPIGLAMATGFLTGMAAFIAAFSFISYNPSMALRDVTIEGPEFLLASILPMGCLLVYGVFAARSGLIMPSRPFAALFAVWHSAEREIREAREDFMRARETIGELQRLNRTLETEQKLRADQVDNSPAAVLEVDRHGAIIKANAPARRLLERPGVAAEPAKPLEALLPGFAAFLHDRDVLSRVLTVPQAAGQPPRHIQVTVLPNGNANYGPALSVIAEDVTEREREAVKRAVSDRVRGIQLTGRVVSHDFSNLMLALEGNLARIVEGLPPMQRDGMHDTLRAISDGMVHGRDMLKQLGSQQPFALPELGLHDVADLIADALRLQEPGARQAQITLASNALHGILVEIDRTQIVRVLLNLIGNAVRATAPGGRIEVTAGSSPEGAVVEVRDTGIGMTKEQLAAAFEPGFSTKGGGQGGLGLAVSYLIVEAHGGSLTLASEPARGTTARIVLPLALAASTGGATALVLAADAMLRDALAEHLLAGGIEPIEVAEPAELEALIAEAQIGWTAVVRATDFPLSARQEAALGACPQLVVNEAGLCRAVNGEPPHALRELVKAALLSRAAA
jgi:signal transduction histidine kinase